MLIAIFDGKENLAVIAAIAFLIYRRRFDVQNPVTDTIPSIAKLVPKGKNVKLSPIRYEPKKIAN